MASRINSKETNEISENKKKQGHKHKILKQNNIA